MTTVAEGLYWKERMDSYEISGREYLRFEFENKILMTSKNETRNEVSASWTAPLSVLQLMEAYPVTEVMITSTRGRAPRNQRVSIDSTLKDSLSSLVTPKWFERLAPPGLELGLTMDLGVNHIPGGKECSDSHGANPRVRSIEEISCVRNEFRPLLQTLGQALATISGTAVPVLLDHGVVTFPLAPWWHMNSLFENSSDHDDVFSDLHANLNERTQKFYRSKKSNTHTSLHGALPQEMPCLDTISSWIKLLPCGSNAGIGSALNADEIVRSPFHSFEIRARKLELDHGTKSIEVLLAVTFAETSGSFLGKRKYFLKNICPLSKYDKSISRDINFLEETEDYNRETDDVVNDHLLSADHLAIEKASNSLSKVASATREIQSLSNLEGWTVNMESCVKPVSALQSHLQLEATLQPKKISRHASEGHLESENHEECVLTNRSQLFLHIFQAFPWEIGVRWSSLSVTINGNPKVLNGKVIADEGISLVLQPSVPRKAGGYFEMLFQMNTMSKSIENNSMQPNLVSNQSYEGDCHQGWTIYIECEIQKEILSVFDVSPDASRGIDIPAAAATLISHKIFINQENASFYSGSKSGFDSSYTRSMPHLLNLPIADASMPFNVICFSSTAIAFLFGSIISQILKESNWKPSRTDEEPKMSTRFKKALRRRALRALIVLLVSGSATIYLDRDLRHQIEDYFVNIPYLLSKTVFSYNNRENEL